MSRGLDQLKPLLGEWVVESKAFSEGRGHATVVLTEEQVHPPALARRRQAFPRGVQLIGSDESTDECTALYYDSRGVYRVYRMTVKDRVWTVWREAPRFNQRFTGSISDDGRTITGQWEMSEDGKHWKVDFDLNYTKVG